MTNFVQHVEAVEELSAELVEAGFAPFLGAPCDALAPLYRALDRQVGVLGVPRDDNAIAIAAGVCLAGGSPAVLLRNADARGSAEVIASVVAQRVLPMLLIAASGERTLVDGVDTVPLDPELPVRDAIDAVRHIVCDQLRPAALLLPATVFGPAA